MNKVLSLIMVLIMLMQRIKVFSCYSVPYQFKIHPKRRITTQLTFSTVEVDTSHLESRGSRINSYWISKLKQLENAKTRNLVKELTSDNVLGFKSGTTSNSKSENNANRKGTLLDFVLQQKVKHSQCIILVRCGDFYETYGIDSLMLIEYAGLNPMGGKCKAGCPKDNIQATLNSLTGVGLSVAVYEEIAELKSGQKHEKSKLKNRSLTQIISPASKTYLYRACLKNEDIDYPVNYPTIGIMSTVNGFLMCEIYTDRRVVEVWYRLRDEAVRSKIELTRFSEPIYLQDFINTNPGSIQDDANTYGGGANNLWRLKSSVSDIAPIERIRGETEENFVHSVLRKVCDMQELNMDEFRIHTNFHSSDRPKSIYISTALQIGLLANPYVPHLVQYLLPKSTIGTSSGSHSQRFFQEWLLDPPPHAIAKQMHHLCHALADFSESLPPFRAVSVDKVMNVLYAKQCNVPLLRSIRANIQSLYEMLIGSKYSVDSSPDLKDPLENIFNPYLPLLKPLLEITSFESGILADVNLLIPACKRILERIDEVILTYDAEDSNTSEGKSYALQPQCVGSLADFFIINEEEPMLRHKLNTKHPKINQIYLQVAQSATELVKTLQKSFPPTTISTDADSAWIIPVELDRTINKLYITRDVRNLYEKIINDLSQNPSPTSSALLKKYKEAMDNLIPVLDLKGKPVAKRFTTREVEDASTNYLQCTYGAPAELLEILQELSRELQLDIVTIEQASHWSVILQSVYDHVTAARQKQWNLPILTSDHDDNFPEQHLFLPGVSPFWIDRRDSQCNDVLLEGIFLLTAPNMSGKSTLMRSVIVAALLANCGLFIPCSPNARVPRYDSFFLRTASYDIPSEAKSAFALEMSDVSVLLKDSTKKSIVMIDELGKGTSSKDGSSLVAALLEHLDQVVGVSGIVATHLHEVFQLPMKLKRVVNKKMGWKINDGKQDPNLLRCGIRCVMVKLGRVEWTYQLEDGICTDSMALTTARYYGLPSSIIERANEFANQFDQLCRASSKPSEHDENQYEDLLSHDTQSENLSVHYESEDLSSQVDLRRNEEDVSNHNDLSFTEDEGEMEMFETGQDDLHDDLSVEEMNIFESSNDFQVIKSMELPRQNGDLVYNPSGNTVKKKIRMEEDVIPIVSDVLERYKDTLPTLQPVLSLNTETEMVNKYIQVIYPDHNPPPYLEGKSCVYILHIRKMHNQNLPDVLYVGETESLRQRLKKHRQQYSSLKGYEVLAIAFRAGNKSTARQIETSLIKRIKLEGYYIDRDFDQLHRLFSS